MHRPPFVSMGALHCEQRLCTLNIMPTELSMDMKRLPKVELHLHLDCSLSYAAVARLAPGVTHDEYLRDYVAPSRCTNLADFLERAPKGFLLMQDESALKLVTEDLFHQLRADGIVYAEIRFAP